MHEKGPPQIRSSRAPNVDIFYAVMERELCSLMRLRYLQSCGSNPEILLHIASLEQDAITLAQNNSKVTTRHQKHLGNFATFNIYVSRQHTGLLVHSDSFRSDLCHLWSYNNTSEQDSNRWCCGPSNWGLGLNTAGSCQIGNPTHLVWDLAPPLTDSTYNSFKNEPYLPLRPSCRASPPPISWYCWYSLCLPTERWPGWVDLGGWLNAKINFPALGELNPDIVTHLSTNRAQCKQSHQDKLYSYLQTLWQWIIPIIIYNHTE